MQFALLIFVMQRTLQAELHKTIFPCSLCSEGVMQRDLEDHERNHVSTILVLAHKYLHDMVYWLCEPCYPVSSSFGTMRIRRLRDGKGSYYPRAPAAPPLAF